MKTPSGKYRIIDITEFLPGRKIPAEWCDEANKNGSFFFLPSNWTEETQWGGINLTRFTKFPMMYSPGFPSPETALEAAIVWEAGEADRAVRELGIQREMTELFK